jgi:hypothetical protein
LELSLSLCNIYLGLHLCVLFESAYGEDAVRTLISLNWQFIVCVHLFFYLKLYRIDVHDFMKKRTNFCKFCPKVFCVLPINFGYIRYFCLSVSVITEIFKIQVEKTLATPSATACSTLQESHLQ